MASKERRENSRAPFLRARDSLSSDEIQSKSLEIAHLFLSLKEYQKTQTLFFYASKESEVNTSLMIEAAWQDGKKVALPRTLDDEHLEARLVTNLERDCHKGRFDILEPHPKKTMEIAKETIDCFVVPGVAFDLKGYRMGWGKGYFDRYLSDLRPNQIKIGLAYELQVCKALQTSPHDVKIDVLVTENRVLRFEH